MASSKEQKQFQETRAGLRYSSVWLLLGVGVNGALYQLQQAGTVPVPEWVTNAAILALLFGVVWFVTAGIMLAMSADEVHGGAIKKEREQRRADRARAKAIMKQRRENLKFAGYYLGDDEK